MDTSWVRTVFKRPRSSARFNADESDGADVAKAIFSATSFRLRIAFLAPDIV